MMRPFYYVFLCICSFIKATLHYSGCLLAGVLSYLPMLSPRYHCLPLAWGPVLHAKFPA
jgi:hypothetical protein